jgi:ABC-type sugar transport system substrate-binding protein
MRARADAKEVPPFVELIRNHAPTAAAALLEALGGEAGAAAVGLTLADVQHTLTPRFQLGVQYAVDATGKLKGLFDSLAKVRTVHPDSVVTGLGS